MTEALQRKQQADKGAADEGRGDCARADEACPRQLCELRSVILACAHGGRNYKLDLAGPPNHDDEHLLQVISNSRKPEVLRIKAIGDCACGHPRQSGLAGDAGRDQRPNDQSYCPTVRLKGPGVWVEQPGDLRVRVYPRQLAVVDRSVAGFFERIFLCALPANRYLLTTHKCNGGTGALRAQIEVYPELLWQLKMSARWQGEKPALGADHPGEDKDRRHAAAEAGNYQVRYRIQVQRDGEQWQLQDNGVNTGSRPTEVFGLLRAQKFKTLMEALDQLLGDDFHASVTPPNITLEGDYKKLELDDDYQVRREFQLRWNFDPFLVCNFKVNILEWLKLRKYKRLDYPAMLAARFEREILQREGKLPPDKLRLDLTIKGEIAGALDWSRSAAQDKAQLQGDLTGAIEFSAEAVLATEGSQWLVQFKTHTTLSLKSAQSSTQSSRLQASLAPVWVDAWPGISGQVAFTGLAWYSSIYIKLGIERLEDRKILPQAVARVFDRMLRERITPEKEVQQDNKLATLFEPFQYPKPQAATGEQTPATQQPLPLGDFIRIDNFA